MEPQPQDKQPSEVLPVSVMEAFAQAMEDAQAAGEPVAEIAEAMADGEIIKAEIIEDAGEGRLLIITAESEAITETIIEAPVEADAQPEDSEPVKKPAHKSKGRKGAASTEEDK